jgi:acid phosphatase class B
VRQHRHVRTLELDLDDTLIHSDWTRGRGWKTFKRPGAEDFIRTMAQYYELVNPLTTRCRMLLGCTAVRAAAVALELA